MVFKTPSSEFASLPAVILLCSVIFLNNDVLECPSSNGRSSLNDVHVVNLSLVSNVQVIREVSPTTIEPPQSLNLQRLNTRVRNQIDEKKRLVMALQAGVSPEGQKLFIAISKTIQDITWNGANIVVFDNVTIRPPYKADNVYGNTESGAYRHVKKVVRKHRIPLVTSSNPSTSIISNNTISVYIQFSI